MLKIPERAEDKSIWLVYLLPDNVITRRVLKLLNYG